MTSRSIHGHVSLNYDISQRVYNDDEIVRCRTYLMNAVTERKLSNDYDMHTTISSYMENLKEKAARRNKVHEDDDHGSSISSQSLVPQDDTNKEDFTLIWLDQTLDTDKPDLRNLTLLRDVVYFLRTFTDLDLCQKYLESIPNENVYLIVSGTTGHIIVPKIHHLVQVRAIYVLCRRSGQQIGWTSAYTKIRKGDIFTSVNPLVERLKVDLYKCQKALNLSYKVEKSVVDIHYQKVDFQWSYLLMQTLISWPEMPKAREQMIKYMRDYFNNSQSDLNFLDELAKTYTASNAVYWYTRPACLFRLVNRAFRQEDIDEIFKYRSFVKDLSEQLKSLYIEQRECGLDSCNVYRGTCLVYDDIAVLKANKNKRISFNGYLSTSIDRNVAKMFIESDDDQQQREAVMFEYYIDGGLETSPYALISYMSATTAEQEVLFDIGAIFRIDYVKYDVVEKIWQVRCVLCEKSEITPLYFDKLTKKDNHFLSIFYFGRVLIEMNDFNRAKAFFTALANDVHDKTAKALCHFGLAIIYGAIQNISRCVAMYETALKYSSELSNKIGNINKVLNIYRKLGIVCNQAGDLDTALECFALDLSLIDDDGTDENNICLAKTLGAIGAVYVRRGETEKALEFYQQEKTLSRKFYKNKPEEVDWNERMAAINIEQGSFDTALEHLGIALTIARDIVSSNHPKLQVLKNNTGLVHLYQGHLDTALEYFTAVSNFLSHEPLLNFLYFALYANFAHLYFLQGKYDLAVTSYENAIANHLERKSSPYHIDLARVYMNFGHVLTKQCKFHAAEAALMKACDIYEQKNLPLRMVDCYRCMVVLYHATHNIKKAFILTAKILSICKESYGENHPQVGIAYREVGVMWSSLGNNKRALQFMTRSVLILEASTPYAPEDCATTYESMGTVLLNSSDMLSAIKCYTKAINIRKKYLSEDHPSIGTIYFLLGRCYFKLDQFDLAHQNYQRALVTGAERHLVELDLADFYLFQNEHDLALAFCKKALTNVKLKFGENHEHFAVVYSRLGMIQCERNEYDAAAQSFMKTLDYFERHAPDHYVNITKYLILVGEALGSADRYTDALAYFERALAKFSKGDLRTLKTRWSMNQCYQGLAEEYYKLSEWSKTLECIEQILAILRQWFPSAVKEIENLEQSANEIRDKRTNLNEDT